ncbi:MAG: hypothetical protein ACRDZP_04940, partial [Acidimicrobiales bacterium]
MGGPDWLVRRRLDALDAFQAASLPTGEEEIWRYSRIGDLDLGRFTPAKAVRASGGLPELPKQVHALVDRIGERSGLALSLEGNIFQADLGERAESAGARLTRLSSHKDGEDLSEGLSASFAGEDAD